MEHLPITPLAVTNPTLPPAKFTGCHFMSKENRDGVEYHLRLKGELDPGVGSLHTFFSQIGTTSFCSR